MHISCKEADIHKLPGLAQSNLRFIALPTPPDLQLAETARIERFKGIRTTERTVEEAPQTGKVEAMNALGKKTQNRISYNVLINIQRLYTSTYTPSSPFCAASN